MTLNRIELPLVLKQMTEVANRLQRQNSKNSTEELYKNTVSEQKKDEEKVREVEGKEPEGTGAEEDKAKQKPFLNTKKATAAEAKEKKNFLLRRGLEEQFKGSFLDLSE